MSMIAWGSSCVNGWDADSNTSNTQMEYAADVAIANGGECLCDSVILQKKRFAGFDMRKGSSVASVRWPPCRGTLTTPYNSPSTSPNSPLIIAQNPPRHPADTPRARPVGTAHAACRNGGILRMYTWYVWMLGRLQLVNY